MLTVLFQWDLVQSHGAGRKIARVISDWPGPHLIIIPRVTAICNEEFNIPCVSDISVIIFKYIYNIPG